MSEFEVVARPGNGHGSQLKPLADAVAATAESGGAVRVPLNGKPAANIEQSVRHWLRPLGLLVRRKVQGDSVCLWAVKKSTDVASGVGS